MLRGSLTLLLAMLLVACDYKHDYKSSDDKGLTFVNRVNINTPEVKGCGKERCDGDVQLDNEQ